jgi:RNA polymerase sigma factor (sigma-70 family)
MLWKSPHPADQAPTPLAAEISSMRPGEPRVHDGLAIVPLRRPGAPEPDYLELRQALRAGHVSISEVDDAGLISALCVTNRADAPVLMLDGEEIVGLNQNRIVDGTILVPARASMRIPVLCVEPGRWTAGGESASVPGRVHCASARAGRFALGRAAPLAQFALWNDLERRPDSFGLRSPHLLERLHGSIERLVAAPEPEDDEVGGIFFRHGVVNALEFCDSPWTWSRTLPKLVASYGADMYEKPSAPSASDCSIDEVEALLVRLGRLPGHRCITAGLGSVIRVSSVGIDGFALSWQSRIIHFAAFVRHIEPPPEASRHGTSPSSPEVASLEACREFIASRLPELRRYGRGRLPSTVRGMADTEDLVQDAVLQCLRRAPQLEFRHPDAMRAYLRHAVRNRIIDEIRRSRRSPAAVEDSPEEPADQGPSPFDQFIARRNSAAYRAALSRLPARSRAAIQLRMHHRLSYDDLARRLGAPSRAAARMVVRRALLDLARTMSRAKLSENQLTLSA